jgi:hypothetical protein
MNWKDYEKAWHHSKKFLAFLVMEILLGSITFYTLHLVAGEHLSWTESLILFALIFNMGFISVAFNLEQAKLDRYTRFVTTFTGMTKANLDEVQRLEHETRNMGEIDSK